MAFTNLKHLWCQRDIQLSIKDRVCAAVVRSVLMHGSETLPFRAEEMQRLSMFGHRQLRGIGRIGWENFVSRSEVRCKVLGLGIQSLEQVLSQNRLKRLGHILRMPKERLPCCTLFYETDNGHSVTWVKSMRTSTNGPARLGTVRIPAWGPRDPPK